MRELLGVPADAEIPDQSVIQLEDGRACTVTKIQGCLGTCSRFHPSVRVDDSVHEERRLKGSSVEVILTALNQEDTPNP